MYTFECDISDYKVSHDALTWKPVCEKLLQSKKIIYKVSEEKGLKISILMHKQPIFKLYFSENFINFSFSSFRKSNTVHFIYSLIGRSVKKRRTTLTLLGTL
jgi:hypothetical protein